MKPIVKIHIGELYASKTPVSIWTVLGSCVSACLFDPVAKIGGMNHILSVGNADITQFDDSARYGINAMEQLINEIVNLGGVRSRFQAKVFGGGHLLGLSEKNRPGPKNVQFVLDFLKMEKIKLAGHNTGGPYSRKLYFHTDTFEAFLKKTEAKGSDQFMEKEAMQIKKVKSIATAPGEITLF